MSLKSWKNEFYPILSEEAAASDGMATLHSLRKWIGALPEIVKRHEVRYQTHTIYEEQPRESFSFRADSCALCARYNRIEGSCYSDDLRRACPIVRLTGSPCDFNGQPKSPWSTSDADPTPMITLLIHTLIFLQ